MGANSEKTNLDRFFMPYYFCYYIWLTAASCAEETTGGILLTCPSAILMEASTKSVIYEKAPDERRSPASITKIMTAILIFDAIEAGKISLEDEVVTSAYAKSMAGLKSIWKKEKSRPLTH